MTLTWDARPIHLTTHARQRWAGRVKLPIARLAASLRDARRARGKAVRRADQFLGHGHRHPPLAGRFMLENVADGIIFVLQRKPDEDVLLTVVTWETIRHHERAARLAREHTGTDFYDEYYPAGNP